ncbi:MAG: universal stress protein [Bryobacteraceae bacterium]
MRDFVPFRRILVPIDLSERSAGAVRYARTIGEHFRSELTLLHVLHPLNFGYSAIPPRAEAIKQLMEHHASDVDSALNRLIANELSGLHVQTVIEEGDPADRIVQYAHSNSMDLIVLPTQGTRPIRQFILGSVTSKVLHDSDCPVWTGVHLEQDPRVRDFELRTIICAVDLGPQSCRLLQWTGALARDVGARVIIVHGIATTASYAKDFFDPNWRTLLSERVRQELAALQKRAGVDGEVIIEEGDPHKVIGAIAERSGADLVTICRGSTPGVLGRLRANAYAIIRHSPCPVVSV